MTISDPRPTGARILVRRLLPADPVGKLVVPDDAKARAPSQIGEVLTLGTENPHGLSLGDIVIYNRGAGLDISHLFDTKEVLLLLNQTQDVVAKATANVLATV